MSIKSIEAKQRKLKWKQEYNKRPETKIKTKRYADKYQKSGKKTAARRYRRHNNPWQYWAQNTHRSHKWSGYIMNISILDLKQMALATIKCPICDKILNWHNDKMKDDSPSLDRINNDSEININNVQIICIQCNTTKNARTMLDFVSYCRMVAEKFPITGVSKE